MSTESPEPTTSTSTSPPEEEASSQGGMAGLLPRFPSSLRRPTKPTTTATEPDGAEGTLPPLVPPPPAPAGPGTGSSPGSTNPDKQPPDKPPPEEWVDPKDLQAAIRQVADIAFVMVGQALGTADKRARGLPQVDPKWVPTKEERAIVLEPAGRIAKRHITADRLALDTIDGCLIAAGVGSFAMRGLFGIEPLGSDNEP